MLAKIRHYAQAHDLKNIYYAIFSSHMMYGSQSWSMKLNSVTDKISKLQKKAIRIITFSDFRDHTDPLFSQLEILKFTDNVTLLNCTFVYDYLNGALPKSFNGIFDKVSDVHRRNTSNSRTGKLVTTSYVSVSYGKKTIYRNCITSWNYLTSIIKEFQSASHSDHSQLSHVRLKSIIKNHFLSLYRKK